MAKAIDLTGQRFGKLVVLEPAGPGAGRIMRWRCRCDCGREKVVYGNNLRGGQIRSCGGKGCKNYTARKPKPKPKPEPKPAPGAVQGSFVPSLCWDCKKAVCGCSWSQSFEPVPGWEATPTVLYAGRDVATKRIESYRVRKCPLFEAD